MGIFQSVFYFIGLGVENSQAKRNFVTVMIRFLFFLRVILDLNGRFLTLRNATFIGIALEFIFEFFFHLYQNLFIKEEVKGGCRHYLCGQEHSFIPD